MDLDQVNVSLVFGKTEDAGNQLMETGSVSSFDKCKIVHRNMRLRK